MNKNKYLLIGAVVIIAAAAFFVFRNNNSAPIQSNYSIGAVLPLSVTAAAIGEPVAEGMKVAVDEINKNGGVNGKKLSLFIEDGQFFGAKSVSAATSLLSNHNPDVFDVIFDLPAQAVGPVLQAAGKPFLHWDYSRTVLEANSLAFKTGFDAETGCAALV